jgi:diguanylate cyclase (GGDEF)-like protein/PAS domain S-box-containing protein
MTLVDSNLLLVDGGRLRSSLLARRLRGKGYEVAEVAGPGQALDWIRRQRVDLVLLNIRVPGFDSLELLRAIRCDFAAHQLPVIMLAGKKQNGIALQALREGANDYASRPVDFRVALARIQNHLALKQAEEALRDSEERYALAARGSIDGLWDWDLRTDRTRYSPRWKAMLGYQDAEIADRPEEWLGRVHAEDIEALRAELKAHLAGRTSHLEQEYRILRKDGNYRWMVVHGVAVRDASGRAYRVAGSQTDITRAKVADPLTGLPNRVLFLDRLDRLMQKVRRNRTRGFAVIFLDLDRFKLINDTVGHLAGDQVLITIARRLERSLRAGDTVARLGGDEFTALLDDLAEAGDAIRIAQRMSAEIARPIILADQEVVATASMGISISSPDHQNAEDVLKEADIAMYRAKMLGKNRIELFDPRVPAARLANW